MNKILFVGPAAALAVLTACTKGGSCDSGDTACGDTGSCDVYSGATYIGVDSSLCEYPVYSDDNSPVTEAVTVDCDSSVWWADIFTVGPADGGADLELVQTGTQNGWYEIHYVPVSGSSTTAGWWTYMAVTLDQVDSTDDVVEGSTTLFNCSDHPATLTYVVWVYDGADAVLDCVIFGDDTSIDTYGYTCGTSWR